MEILIQNYGTLGCCLVIIFQLMNLKATISKIEIIVEEQEKRIENLERKGGKNGRK